MSGFYNWQVSETLPSCENRDDLCDRIAILENTKENTRKRKQRENIGDLYAISNLFYLFLFFYIKITKFKNIKISYKL